jgi:beta-glucosidase-like glycosyl hydrolase
MAGAAELGDIGPRTVAAFNAGHDLLLFGRDWEQAALAYDYFIDAYRREEISEERVSAALGRVSGVKFKLDSSVIP